MPALPSPVMRTCIPSSTPAGMVTVRVRRRRSTPCARQFEQGVAMVRPAPLQAGQGVVTANCPKTLRCARRTWPEPAQVTQDVIGVPGSLPAPEQFWHGSMRTISKSRSQPNTASSKVSVMRWLMSSPARAWLAVRPPPPKKVSKISPNPPKGSKPSKGRSLPPLTPAWPKRS